MLTVVGARPQIVKAAPVSLALAAAGHEELLVHSGQHYDPMMSQVFFEDLGLLPPHVNLGVGSGSHGRQTARIIERAERVMAAERPDWVVVYGDTNTTLGAALAACKLGLPLAHVEAGMRSGVRAQPEECNRVLTDHCAEALFCATETARANLAREGIERGVHVVGDTMADAARLFGDRAHERSQLLSALGVRPREYCLATIHRPANTDDPVRLAGFLRGLDALGEIVIFPAHPRTRMALRRLRRPRRKSATAELVRIIEPLGYLDMLMLERNAKVVLTDSGGVQREAYLLGVPCITLREETEWPETLHGGWNRLAGPTEDEITAAFTAATRAARGPREDVLGDGHAAGRIVEALAASQSARGAGGCGVKVTSGQRRGM